MDTTSINGLYNDAITETSAPGRPNKELSEEDFMRILMAELSNQDPFEPVDNREFLGQLTQLKSYQAMADLSGGIKDLLLGSEITSASALIGLEVRGTADSGASVEGIVSKVAITDGRVRLVVGDEMVALANIREILGREE